MLQLAIPSRERVELYRQLRDDIDRLVGRINGDTHASAAHPSSICTCRIRVQKWLRSTAPPTLWS